MDLFFPRYAAPGREGLIPPSPPAESRARDWAALQKQVQTYRGRMPTLVVPGYYEPDAPSRVILPGQKGYQETLRRVVAMPAGNACVMTPPTPPASSILTGLKFSYSLNTTGWLANVGPNLTGNGTPTNPAGQIGNALGCNGTNQFLNTSTVTAFDLSNSDATITTWLFAATGIVSFARAWSKYDATGAIYNYSMAYGSTTFHFEYVASDGLGGHVSADWGSSVSLNTWYFVRAWTVLATGVTSINVNEGTPATHTNATHPGWKFVNSGQWRMGVDDPSNLSWWKGDIDETNGLNRLLTDSEITQLAAGNSLSAYPFS